MSTATNDVPTSPSQVSTAPIPYATPSAVNSPPSRTGAGVAMICGGLGLIVLAGCFLIGVLVLIESPSGGSAGPSGLGLMYVLYALAGICFIGAALLIFYGARGLLRIIRG